MLCSAAHTWTDNGMATRVRVLQLKYYYRIHVVNILVSYYIFFWMQSIEFCYQNKHDLIDLNCIIMPLIDQSVEIACPARFHSHGNI